MNTNRITPIALAAALTPLRARQVATQLGPDWLRDMALLLPHLHELLPDMAVPSAPRKFFARWVSSCS